MATLIAKVSCNAFNRRFVAEDVSNRSAIAYDITVTDVIESVQYRIQTSGINERVLIFSYTDDQFSIFFRMLKEY